jgi:hypothetical protein
MTDPEIITRLDRIIEQNARLIELLEAVKLQGEVRLGSPEEIKRLVLGGYKFTEANPVWHFEEKHTHSLERGMPSHFKITQKPTEALSPDYKRQLIDAPGSMTVNAEFKGQHVTVIKHGKNTP